MKRSHFLLSLILLTSWNQPSENNDLISRNIELAVLQYKNMAKQLPEDRFPRSYENGKFTTSNSGWWCSGFYPGSLLYLFEESKDSTLLSEAERMLDLLEKEQYNTSTHDLGFMMYCSFGNALKIAPKPEYKEVLMNSAKSLSTRFSPTVGCIRSWDSEPEDFLVIIDNMMNLELLFWATKHTGDSSFYKIAVTHADKTIKNHFRPDSSSYHVLNYDPKTGDVREKRTAQGLNDSSAWARGQAWGLYGFTTSYRETGKQRYLNQALAIAEFILNHSNLPDDMIPVWDFDAAEDAPRDASAATIIASALLELDNYTERDYKTPAKKILESLTKNYTANPGENGNFIIQHCVGHLPANSEVDVPLTYADYYFIEGLKRLKNGVNYKINR